MMRFPALLAFASSMLCAVPCFASAPDRGAGASKEPTPAVASTGAPSPSSTSTPSDGETTRWYGWQTLIVDATAFGVMILPPLIVGGWESLSAIPIGATAYLLGGPIVHAAHGNLGRTALSFVMRLGIPALASGSYLLLADGCSPDATGSTYGCWGPAVGVVVAGIGGAVFASAIDIAALSYERKAPPKPSAMLDIRRTAHGGTVVGLAGTF